MGARQHGSSLLDGPSRPSCRGGRQRWYVAARGRCAIWDWRKHRDPLDADGSPDRKPCSWADGWPQTEEACRRASRLADPAMHRPRFRFAWAGSGTCRTRPYGGLPFGLGIRSCGEAQLQKKRSSPPNRIALISPDDARNGEGTSTWLIPPGLSLSMRPGPRPTWRLFAAGGPAVNGLWPRSHGVTGTP